LRTLQSVAVGLLLVLLAAPAAMYFKEPKVEHVLWILAVCVSVAGASNIGITLALKEFNFALDFRIQVICKVLGVVATVGAGFLLRDYRALVIGVATGYLGGFAMTYWMHPYRPRWNTSKIGEIWLVTRWLMLAGVGGFILRKGDEVMAARIGTTEDFGAYNVGADLGQLPTGEVGPAMLNAFLPVLASMRGGVDEVNAAVIKTVAAINTITFPIGLGFAAVAGPATRVILGQAWSTAAQYVAPFAIVGTLQIIQSPYRTLLTMRGHTKIQSYAVWLEFVTFLAAAAALVPSHFLLGLVWARGLGSIASLALTLYATRRHCDLHLRPSATVLLRPLIGAILMYALVAFVTIQVEGDALKLTLGIACGAVTFTAWSLATWFLIGKPDGLESTVLEYLMGIRKAKQDLHDHQ
jgi:O-antigen/teichoic acid export membrane protein